MTDLRRGKRKVEFDKGTVRQLLEKLSENSETVLVSVNGKIFTEDYKLTKKDRIELIPIVSGG